MLVTVTNYIKNILAPPFCVQCQVFLNTHTFLCQSCIGTIMPVVTKTLIITKKYSAKVYAVGQYKDPLRSLIMAKHVGNRLASVQLGQLLWERTDIRFADFDIIVPVPLHWTRHAQRWFNQSEIMAQYISSQSGKPVISLLQRVKRTKLQAGLTKQERHANIEKAFMLTKDAYSYKGKKILLIDDVMTTGTTLHACSRKLVDLKPEQLCIGVVSRVV